MWIAKFQLKDDHDIYSPLCIKHKIEMYAVPLTQYTKADKIHLLVGVILSGSDDNKERFIASLKKDKRIERIEQYHDFLLVHAAHPASREQNSEIKVFYNPQYIRVKPVHVASDGWEYWEVACLDREELNKLIQAARKHYHGKLCSMKRETLKSVANLAMMPNLTSHQFDALNMAYRQGYYTYPRTLTIPELAKQKKKSYSTFQEHLRKAENKLMEFFIKYR